MATAANERLNYKAHFLPFQLCRWHSSLRFHYFPFLFFFSFSFSFSLSVWKLCQMKYYLFAGILCPTCLALWVIDKFCSGLSGRCCPMDWDKVAQKGARASAGEFLKSFSGFQQIFLHGGLRGNRANKLTLANCVKCAERVSMFRYVMYILHT